MEMNPVVYFQIPAENKKRMIDFYTNVFGWHASQLGADMGEYVTVTTTDTDEKTSRPTTPGAINGGFYLKPNDPVGQHMNIVIAVDDVIESVKKVEEAGGKIHGQIDDIPGVGKTVSVIDPEGNHIVMLEPGQMG